MRLLKSVLGTVGALVLLAAGSQAKPEYAKREKRACAYCHINPAGGGARNMRGAYYETHEHSFKGFNEATTANQDQKKTGPPAFKSTWKMNMPAAARRIAVGDVAGDKKPRLLMLGEGGALTIYRIKASALEKEEEVDLGKDAAQFVVGRFAKDKPALIVAPGVIFYRDGEKYARKEVADLSQITGSVKFTDGTENLFYFGGGGEPDVWAVDLAADKPLTPGRQMVEPTQGGGTYGEMIGRVPPDVLAQFGLPEEATKSGIFGLYDPRSDNNLYALLPWLGADGSYVVLVEVGQIGNNPGELKPTWKSPKLQGKVLDVVLSVDPLEGKQPGIYVLQSIGQEDRDRIVEFFALD